MSILIKGIEMPKSCWDCYFQDCGNCRLNDDKLVDKCIVEDRIDEDCPLIPVPPHGRLIDADAFEEENAYFWNRDFINPKYSDTLADLVNDAPTIIPAENKGYILTPQEEYDGRLKRKCMWF